MAQGLVINIQNKNSPSFKTNTSLVSKQTLALVSKQTLALVSKQNLCLSFKTKSLP